MQKEITFGEMLKKEWLDPMKIDVVSLSASLGVSKSKIESILDGYQTIDVDFAMRLSRFFPGTDVKSWLNLQIGCYKTKEQSINKSIIPKGSS